MTADRPPEPDYRRGRLYALGLRSLALGIFLWVLVGTALIVIGGQLGRSGNLSILPSEVVSAVVGVMVIAAAVLTAVGFPIVWRVRRKNLAARRRESRPGDSVPRG